MRKLRELENTGVFEIIDQWTHMHVETLGYDDAVAKYGDCEIWGEYTEGFVDGPRPFRTSVWIMVPGRHLRSKGPYGECVTVADDGTCIPARYAGRVNELVD